MTERIKWFALAALVMAVFALMALECPATQVYYDNIVGTPSPSNIEVHLDWTVDRLDIRYGPYDQPGDGIIDTLRWLGRPNNVGDELSSNNDQELGGGPSGLIGGGLDIRFLRVQTQVYEWADTAVTVDGTCCGNSFLAPVRFRRGPDWHYGGIWHRNDKAIGWFYETTPTLVPDYVLMYQTQQPTIPEPSSLVTLLGLFTAWGTAYRRRK